MPQTIGDHVKKKRLQLGLTQKAVARTLKVGQFSVINWERGDFQPHNVFTLHRVIRFLGYDPLPDGGSIPDRLRVKRRQMGWGQRELADHLGVDSSTVKNWEGGGTIMKRAHRALIAGFLGLPELKMAASMRDRWKASHGKLPSKGAV